MAYYYMASGVCEYRSVGNHRDPTLQKILIS